MNNAKQLIAGLLIWWLSLPHAGAIPVVVVQPSAAIPTLIHHPPAIRAQIKQLHQVAQTRPRDANAAGKLGMALHAYNEYVAAAQWFARARGLAPGEMRWTYFAGLTQAALGNTTEALTFFQQVADYDPAKIKAADLLLAQNKPNEAETLYRAAIKNNPSPQWAWYGLGRVNAARQDWTGAMQAFEQAIALSPQFGAAHYALALALREMGQLDNAKKHLAFYQAYQQIRPPVNDVWADEIAALNIGEQESLRRGVALAQDGNLDDAVREHKQALEVNPNFLQAHINLIQLYGRLNQPTQAEIHYRRAVQINPSAAEAHYNFGVVLVGAQKQAAAKTAFAQALVSNPHFAEAHFNLGILALQDARLTDAIAHFQASLESQPNNRSAHFELGRIFVHQQNYAAALQHFQQTLTPEDQDTPRYLYALAATNLRMGNRGEGVSLLQRARQRAAAFGQQELLSSIERDLKTLEEK